MADIPDIPIVRPKFPELCDYSGGTHWSNYSEVGIRIEEMLASGQVTNNGAWVQEFERRLTEYLGAPTLCFSSGMAALITMVRAFDMDFGPVLCPSFTFAATPHAIKMVSLWGPLFVDVDEDMVLDDAAVVAAAVRFEGKYQPISGVMAVDPYGALCDADALQAAANQFKKPLIIDSAAAFGSAGASPRGDAQIFSFHATKPFTTMEGGCLTSRNPDIIERARKIRNFGQDEDGDCPLVGINGKMTEVCAIIGLEQLKTWPETVKRRQSIATWMNHHLVDIPGISVPEAARHPGPIWTYFPIFIEDSFGKSREVVLHELRARGIMARRYYTPPCHELSVYFNPDVSLPVTELLASRVIALPLLNDMEGDDVIRIERALREIRG